MAKGSPLKRYDLYLNEALGRRSLHKRMSCSLIPLVKRDFEKEFGYDSYEENEFVDAGPDGIVLQLRRGLKNRRAKTKESLILASIQKAA